MKSNCEVEVKCKIRVGDVWRFNILADGDKYSKNFPYDTTDDEAKKDAEHSCESGLLKVVWDEGWTFDCP